jgi:hypothetical protein
MASAASCPRGCAGNPENHHVSQIDLWQALVFASFLRRKDLAGNHNAFVAGGSQLAG